MSYGRISIILFKSICLKVVKEERIMEIIAIDNIIGRK